MAVRTDQYADSISTSTLRHRQWIRHERPIWPFVWRGLLPVLGMLCLGAYAIAPFARNDIEATVMQETRAQLASQGFGWANIVVSGQHVKLSGVQPKTGDGDAAMAIARAATCPSLAGHLTCAVAVSGQFAETIAPPAAAPSPAAALPTPAAAIAQRCEKSLADILAKSKIEFATGSAAIHSSSAGLLDALAKAVRECPGTIRIEGHTDSSGEPVANKELSIARAQAVRTALVAQGIAADQMQAEGFGEEAPIADNATEAGRAQNRRIEFRTVATNRN
jgi:outer membrane protein OmpA-like peptidoglycan-associated protein